MSTNPAPGSPGTHRDDVTAAVLAGGRATRMGGSDKGLVTVGARPMVSHIVAALEQQVDHIIINANRNVTKYQALGRWPVVCDTVAGYAGPLAGIASVIEVSPTPMVMSVPCDSPLPSPELASRLWSAISGPGNREIAVAHDGHRLQPVFALIRCGLLESLQAYLDAGERKIDRWYALHNTIEVDFADYPETFLNINTPQELQALEQRLALYPGS